MVGLAEVVADGRPDPENPKLAVADFRFLRTIEPPVTLREIKESGKFDDWALVRQSSPLQTMGCAVREICWNGCVASVLERSSKPGSPVSPDTLFIPNLEYF